MKAVFISPKYKRFNKARINNRLKRNLKFKKQRNNKRKAYQGKSNAQRAERRERNDINRAYTKIDAPNKFSFIQYPEEVTSFINQLENLYLNNRPAFVNLSNVEYLDHSAITVLASIARTFKVRKVKLNGNLPKKNELRELFIESDFFKHFAAEEPATKIEYNIGKNNQMFTTKDAQVNPELGLAVMQEASQVIWNKKRTCKGLQRVLLELMQNANNHAKLKDKGSNHWWLSVNHDKDKKIVSFIFVDYGIGIFESLNSKSSGKWLRYKDKILDRIKNDKKILQQLMDGKLHKTVTGEPFRGKGLPGIKQVLDRKQISELYVASNKVFANISQNQYTDLPQSFNGTFVYWELNHNNESSRWVE